MLPKSTIAPRVHNLKLIVRFKSKASASAGVNSFVSFIHTAPVFFFGTGPASACRLLSMICSLPRKEGVIRSVAQSCPTLCDPMNRSTPGLPVHHQLPESLKLMSVELVMPSSHLILCHPLLLLPPIPPTIRVFSNESTLRMRWPKYWSFSFSVIPSNEIPGLISFRMDWLDLLAVQGTLKSPLQHHSSKASILWCSAFFTVQLISIRDHRKNHSLD